MNTLARTLLKHDFNLQVEIPDKKLIPALPLRLNYILWIEDLMRHLLLKDKVDDLTKIHGIDIGKCFIYVSFLEEINDKNSFLQELEQLPFIHC